MPLWTARCRGYASARKIFPEAPPLKDASFPIMAALGSKLFAL